MKNKWLAVIYLFSLNFIVLFICFFIFLNGFNIFISSISNWTEIKYIIENNMWDLLLNILKYIVSDNMKDVLFVSIGGAILIVITILSGKAWKDPGNVVTPIPKPVQKCDQNSKHSFNSKK